MPQPTPLNDSLNVSKERWGMPMWSIGALIVIAGLVGYFHSALAGLTIAFLIPCVSKALVSLDPQIYRLAALSLSQKASYDPGRRRR